jgi:glyoxylase-like metal-dependent hydrolase (beta-lactamase superfamily II)
VIARPPDPTAVFFSTRRSRAVGYGVHVFFTRGVMIDTGFHGVRSRIDRLVAERRPQGAIVTHHHEDHAGNIELLAARGTPISAAPETFAAARAPSPIGFYRRFVWSPMPALRSPVVPFEHPSLSLIHAPGHSPDHHVVWDPERETLFSGDLYLSVKVRVARPGEDPRLLARSLRSIAELRPARMFDAHRGDVPHPVASLVAKADWLEAIIARIDRHIDAGWSDSAIRKEIFGGEDPIAFVAGGDLSRMNFVRAVRGTHVRSPRILPAW